MSSRGFEVPATICPWAKWPQTFPPRCCFCLPFQLSLLLSLIWVHSLSSLTQGRTECLQISQQSWLNMQPEYLCVKTKGGIPEWLQYPPVNFTGFEWFLLLELLFLRSRQVELAPPPQLKPWLWGGGLCFLGCLSKNYKKNTLKLLPWVDEKKWCFRLSTGTLIPLPLSSGCLP